MNFFQRLVTGATLVGMVLWVLFISPVWVFALVVTVFTGLALHEFYTLVERKGIQIERWIGLAIGLLIPISVCSRFEPTKGWELLFMVLALLTLFILQLRRRDSSQAIVGVSTALFGIFYISWCFSFLIRLRFLQGPNLPGGEWLVAYLLAVTKGGDIGAWAVGSALGRNSLIPRISPKKTWEGFVGGLLFSGGAAVAFKAVFPAIETRELLFLGVLLGALGQVGDLTESMVKRDSQVKDSGGLFPGMGGVLDVLDSLLFTSPICYFYVLKFWVGTS